MSQTEYNAQIATVPSQSTDSSGNFTFSAVTAGFYVVCDTKDLSVSSTGWIQSQPSSGSECASITTGANPALANAGYAFTLTSGQSKTGVVFGNFHSGAVSGTKFEDQNGDGIITSDGTVPAGPTAWTIRAYADTNTANGVLDAAEFTAGYGFSTASSGCHRSCMRSQHPTSR